MKSKQDIDLADKNSFNTLLSQENQETLNKQDYKGNTALHKVAHLELFYTSLVEQGANENIPNYYGYTPKSLYSLQRRLQGTK